MTQVFENIAANQIVEITEGSDVLGIKKYQEAHEKVDVPVPV
jgi:hypothetical protein